jgi:hypothetical protein
MPLRCFFTLALGASLIATASAQNVPSYVPQNGLQGWWPFNGNANDESGNGINGAVSGALLTEDRHGDSNAAYAFNGMSDYIDLGNQFNNLEAFTFSGWIQRTTPGQLYDEVFSKEACFSIAVDNGNQKMHINFGNGTVWNPANLALTSESTIPFNEWTHVAVTRTWPDGETFLYINGVLDNTGSFPVTGSNANPVHIGSKFSGAAPYFPGDIDDIGWWNTSLDRFAVYDLYLALESRVGEQLHLQPNVWPNPSSEVINIRLHTPATTEFTVVDLSGKRIAEGRLTGDLTTIETRHWPSGSYFILFTDSALKPAKIMVLR